MPKRLKTLYEAREEADVIAIKAALAACGNRVVDAAEALDVSRPTVYALMRKYSIRHRPRPKRKGRRRAA